MQWLMSMSNSMAGEPPNTCSVNFPSCLLVKLAKTFVVSHSAICMRLGSYGDSWESNIVQRS